MYAKWIGVPPPVQDEPIGYDLTAGDWTAPHGKGTNKDMMFTLHSKKHAENSSDYKLRVSFPRPADGIQSFQVSDADKGSELRSQREAPADGYESEWVQARDRPAGQGATSNRDGNRIYFFRVRTVVDQQGNIRSALYGKIYGDFMQLRYFLNPTPNDRNVEFDTSRNLFSETLQGGVSMDKP